MTLHVSQKAEKLQSCFIKITTHAGLGWAEGEYHGARKQEQLI